MIKKTLFAAAAILTLSAAAAHAAAELAGEVQVFAELRRWKDSYKSNLR